MWEYGCYSAFGVCLRSPVSLPLRPDDGAARPAVALRPLAEDALAARWSGAVRRLWGADRDGIAVSVERGHRGDHRIRAEGIATFLLAADGSELTCATDGDRECGWQRILDELALPCTSLLLGHEALHAGAVALNGGAVALLAPSGGGKSTLVSALLDAGGALLSDDVLVLRRTDDGIVAEPGAPVLKHAAGRSGAEVRTAFACTELAACPVALVVVLARGGAGASATPRIEPLGASPMPVLTHALSLPSTPERAGARLALYDDLLAGTAAVRLVADARETPARLAELVVRAASAREAVLA
jgi:hypothetical protein